MPPLLSSPDDESLPVDLASAMTTSGPAPSVEAAALIYRITESIRDSLDEAVILSTLTQSVVSVLALECCQVELYDETRFTAHIAYEYAVSAQRWLGQQRQVQDFQTIYQPLLARASEQFVELEPYWGQHPVRLTWFACPIFDSQDIFGNLWLAKPSAEWFSWAEQNLIQQVANHCAIAIRQARLHQAVQAQVVELAQLNQLKDDFLQLISHELLAPISSIQLAGQTLEKLFTESGWLKPQQKKTTFKILGILQQACKRQSSLVDNLLALIVPDFKAAFEPTLIELQVWLPSLLRSFRNQLEHENLSLSVQLTHELPPIEFDSQCLERILNELLTNALKYTPPGETISITATHQGNQLTLTIQNTGVEISPEHLPHIFDKFYRVTELDRQNYGGTGLGLALVKKLVTESGGQIQAVSQNQTTTFNLSLPLRSQR